MDRIHMARITGMRTTLWRLAALLITAFFCLGDVYKRQPLLNPFPPLIAYTISV